MCHVVPTQQRLQPFADKHGTTAAFQKCQSGAQSLAQSLGHVAAVFFLGDPKGCRARFLFLLGPCNAGLRVSPAKNKKTKTTQRCLEHAGHDLALPQLAPKPWLVAPRRRRHQGPLTRSSSSLRLESLGTNFFREGTLPQNRVQGHYWGT